jgi:LacI family transcriptional regulator
MTNVTIRDVAAVAGVSIGSVSKALNGDPAFRARSETAERIRLVARQLGYQANSSARLLRRQASTVVGLAVSIGYLKDSVINRMVIQLQEELACQSFQALLVEPRQMMPSNSHTPFPSVDMLAGVISADWQMERMIPEFYTNLQHSLPLISLYPTASRSIDVVTADRATAVELAVDHLFELGHRHIAFAEAPSHGNPTQQMKHEGWMRSCKKYRWGKSNLIDLPHQLSPREKGEYLAAQVTNLPRRPTGIVCGSETAAIYAMKQWIALGWRIGADISIVGASGGGLVSDMVWPPLTTMEYPVNDIVTLAVGRLKTMMQSRQDGENPEAKHNLLPPKLTVRASTARPVRKPRRDESIYVTL